MSRWNDAHTLNSRDTYVGGTGSISCLGLTPEEGANAEARRGTLGFRVWRIPDEIEVNAVDPWLQLGPIVNGRWGEAAWTARDLLIDMRRRA